MLIIPVSICTEMCAFPCIISAVTFQFCNIGKYNRNFDNRWTTFKFVLDTDINILELMPIPLSLIIVAIQLTPSSKSVLLMDTQLSKTTKPHESLSPWLEMMLSVITLTFHPLSHVTNNINNPPNIYKLISNVRDIDIEHSSTNGLVFCVYPQGIDIMTLLYTIFQWSYRVACDILIISLKCLHKEHLSQKFK